MFPKSYKANVSESRTTTLYTISHSTTTTNGAKRKVFLLSFLKTRSNRAFYANGSALPTNGRPPMMHQQPPPQQYQQQYQQQYPQQHPQYQPYMQQHPEQMIPPQMYESNETRGGAATTTAASSGIGSFFRI